MKTKGFAYQFTLRELIYLLFKPKVCPCCGSKLIKSKQNKVIDGESIATVSTPLYIKGRNINYYYYLFNCGNCDVQLTLSDLANKDH